MNSLTTLLSALLKTSAVLIVLNEIRGFILAVPVIVAIYESGGSAMAVWIGICSLAGIALSVAIPVFAAKRLGRYTQRLASRS